jgi:hypothetical protein
MRIARGCPWGLADWSQHVGRDVETFHEDGQWWNRVKGQADDRQGPYEIKEAAVEHGRNMARNSKTEHPIRGLDGRIHERNSYGNDPAASPASLVLFSACCPRNAVIAACPDVRNADRRRNGSLQLLRERLACLE